MNNIEDASYTIALPAGTHIWCYYRLNVAIRRKTPSSLQNVQLLHEGEGTGSILLTPDILVDDALTKLNSTYGYFNSFAKVSFRNMSIAQNSIIPSGRLGMYFINVRNVILESILSRGNEHSQLYLTCLLY
jgi:hypothetical protein